MSSCDSCAAVARRLFARHADGPRTHDLHRRAVFVERKDPERRVRRNGEVGAPVFVDRDGAEHLLDVPAALYADRLVPAAVEVAEVIGEQEKFFDRSGRHPFRPLAVIDVGDEHRRHIGVLGAAVLNDRRGRLLFDRGRPEEPLLLDLGDQSQVAERVGQVDAVRAGILGLLAVDQNVFAPQRIGEDEVVTQTARLQVDDVPDDMLAAARDFGVEAGLLKRKNFRMRVELRTRRTPLFGFRMVAERVFPPDGRVDDQKPAGVAAAMMAAADPDDAGRVGELARVFERGREERAAPIQLRLVRAVRIHVEQDPAVVVHNVAVFPAQIHDPPVFQRGRMPVRILLEGELADFFRFRIDLVDVRHQVASVNTGKPLKSGVRTADDRAVRRVAGVEEVDVGLVGRREGL